MFLIWSNEHRAWWKANEWGYTTLTHLAGQYSEARAREIVTKANIAGKVNEVMVLAPTFGDGDSEFLEAASIVRADIVG